MPAYQMQPFSPRLFRSTSRLVAMLLAAFAMSATPVHAEALSELTPAATDIEPLQQSTDEGAPAELDDPLLQSPPAPIRSLHSWQEALMLVHQTAPRYGVQLEGLRTAQAQARQALAALLPTLNAQASYDHQFITEVVRLGFRTPVQNTNGLVGTLNWPVLDARKFYGLGTADMSVDMAEQTLAEQRRELAGDVLNAIVTALASERTAELSRVGLRAALDRAQLTRTKLRFGQGTTLDVARASQDAFSARSEVIKGDEAMRQAREALGLVLGSASEVAVSQDMSIERFQRAVIDTCHMNRSVEDRADVRAARLNLQLAKRGVTDLYLDFAPSVSLQSQVSYNSQVTYGPKTNWDVQAVLSVPVFDGGTRYAQLDQARSVERQARATLLTTRLQALIDLTQATRAVSVMTASLTVAEKQRLLAQSIDQSTRTAYADGLGTSLDLVTSAQALRQAEINRAIAQFNLVLAQARSVLANADCQF